MTVAEEFNILRMYDRFLCTVNDWYATTEQGKRIRMIHPNSYIGLNTHLPSLVGEDDSVSALSFDIEYEFGVIVPINVIKAMQSVKQLFYGIVSRQRIHVIG